MKSRHYLSVLLIISAILLILAIIYIFPYRYYIILRWIVFVCTTCVIAFVLYLEKRSWVWIMVSLLVLFNPIIPFSFTVLIWRVIDLVTAIIFIIAIFKITENKNNYLVFGNRGVDYLGLAESPYALHAEKSKQKLIKERIEYGQFSFSSSYYLAHAIYNFTQAIRLNPKCATSYLNRARCYFINREFQKAMDDYTKMIEVDPHDSDIDVAYFYRGRAYKELSEARKAINDFKKAMELDPENSAVYKKCIDELETKGTENNSNIYYTYE